MLVIVVAVISVVAAADATVAFAAMLGEGARTRTRRRGGGGGETVVFPPRSLDRSDRAVLRARLGEGGSWGRRHRGGGGRLVDLVAEPGVFHKKYCHHHPEGKGAFVFCSFGSEQLHQNLMISGIWLLYV